MEVLILAAGKSTRIASISKGLPKPLLSIGGQSIIKHNLAWLARYGFTDPWVNLHYEPQIIQAHLAHHDIHFLKESEILGTAGAFVNVAAHWPEWEDALIVYGDNLLQFDLNKFVAFHKGKNAFFSMAVFSQTHNKHTGIAGGRLVLDDSQRITEFVENTSSQGSGADFVNAGVYLINKKLLPYFPAQGHFCDFAKDIMPVLFNQQVPIYAYCIEGFCLGLDTPESFLRAKEMLKAKEIVL